MYSYEERMRAVRLYIKLGLHVGATIRELGYPTKNALKDWYRKYQRHHDLPAGYIRTKPRYSDEQKRIAVEYYLCHGHCLAETRKALGYPNSTTLSAWIDEHAPDARRRVIGKIITGKPRSEKQRRAAVIDLCSRSESAREVAQKMDISRQTLYNWKNQQFGREAPSSMARNRNLPPPTDLENLEREFEELRRNVLRLQLEHDLLQVSVRPVPSGESWQLWTK